MRTLVPARAGLVLAALGVAALVLAPAPAFGAEIGKRAPEFGLVDLDGRPVRLSDFKGRVVVLEWFNPGCPFVRNAHTKGALVDAAARAQKQGVVWLAVNSGAPGKQGTGAATNKAAAAEWAMKHPVLLDESGAAGRAYGATNTPHMFVIDRTGTLVYKGAVDNSPDGEKGSPEGGVLREHVSEALADLAAGRPVRVAETKAYGCSVKYAQ